LIHEAPDTFVNAAEERHSVVAPSGAPRIRTQMVANQRRL